MLVCLVACVSLRLCVLCLFVSKYVCLSKRASASFVFTVACLFACVRHLLPFSLFGIGTKKPSTLTVQALLTRLHPFVVASGDVLFAVV